MCLLHYWKQLTRSFVNFPSYFHVEQHDNPHLNNAIKWKGKTETPSVHLTQETFHDYFARAMSLYATARIHSATWLV